MESHEASYFGGRDDFVTVRHRTLRGTNFEIGYQIGALARERYGAAPARYRADPLFAGARRCYLQRHYPIHWERVRGVAAAFALEPEDDRYDLTNLMYNADLPPQGIGCSVVYYPPAAMVAGGGYLSRNYDFSIGTMADLLHLPLPPAATAPRLPPIMSEPYIMGWYPEDGGYASLAVHCFDLLSGTLEGINSAGLAVAMMADDEAIAELGPRLEMHLGPPRVTGVHELQVLRLLLDTCANVDEAKEAMLTIKQHYIFVPCHYLIADRAGHSFIYENSVGRNVQHVITGTGQPQIATNFELYRHPTPEEMPDGPLTAETNAFWRYRALAARIAAHRGPFTPDELKENNACVNSGTMFRVINADPAQRGIAAGSLVRTLWHSLYDVNAGAAEFSFYLGDDADAESGRSERRSEYVRFALAGE